MRTRTYASIAAAAVLLASAGYVGAANLAPPEPSVSPVTAPPGTARFITYNVVRGTRMPAPRMLVRDSTVDANLAQIGKELGAQGPVVVALQETEWGSGHSTENIARAGAFAHWIDDGVLRGGEARHGSALLGSEPLTRPESDMLPRGTTFRKGWIAATVHVPAFNQPVRVVAVHLDPLSPAARQRQVNQLVETFHDEAAPLVVMGDFNCEWSEEGCVRHAADALQLTAAPTHDDPTYRFAGLHRNLDWILVSRELTVIDARVIDNSYSDHCMVMADVAIEGKSR